MKPLMGGVSLEGTHAVEVATALKSAGEEEGGGVEGASGKRERGTEGC